MSKKSAKSPLLTKLLRDLRDGWKSFLAILIICALAIILYMGLDASWRAIDMDLTEQFEQSNMADMWVSGQLSERSLRDIAALPGVSQAQRRVGATFDAPALDQSPTLTLVANEGEPLVCIPLLREGRLPQAANEAMLSENFAKAQGIQPGDSIRIEQGDRQMSLLVTGLGLLPEFVVSSEGDELAPSALKKGYAYVTRETLGYLPLSEIALTLVPGADLGEVRAAVQALSEERQVVVIEREEVFGIKMATEQSQQIRALGAIFPLIFFVIAALITWTTMNRLIESQRLQIGSLFAMGYTRRELLGHYAGYGILVAVAGLIIGIAGALWIVAPIVLYFTGTAYAMPDAQPYLSPVATLVVGLALMAMTGGASMLSARSALSQTPASLLRPKPPGKGKRVFLERIKWLWRRLPFSEKMILRNMLRSPMRLLIGLIGAIGCSALMLSGFGMRDSVNYVMINHYTRTMHYDIRVSLQDQLPDGYAQSLALRTGADAFELEMITSAEVQVQDEWRMKQVYVLEDAHDMIRLNDESGEALTLPASGLALTRVAADEYGLGVGDQLTLRRPGGRSVQARVSHIIDLQLNQGVYMTRSAWKALDLSPFMPTHVLLRGSELSPDEILERLDGSTRARTLDQERDTGMATLGIMNIVVLLLVLFSGALELVVFYNLGQLNFSERIRELATLKVLGFTKPEMKKLVLRENILITAMGLPLGLLVGPPLLNLLLTYGLPNTIQFIPIIATSSWLYTAAITMAFAFLVNLILGAKFKTINMVEALKSVE